MLRHCNQISTSSSQIPVILKSLISSPVPININSIACILSSCTDRQRSFLGSLCILSGRITRVRAFLQGLLLAFVMLANAWAVEYPEGSFGCEYKISDVWKPQSRINGFKAEAWRSPLQNQSVTAMRFGRTVKRDFSRCGTYTVTVGVKAGIGYLYVRGQEVGQVSNSGDAPKYQSFTFVMYQNETAKIELRINLSSTPYAGGSLTWSENSSDTLPNAVVAPGDLWSSVPTDYNTNHWHQKTWTPTPTYLTATSVTTPSLWRDEYNFNSHVGLAVWKKKFVAPEPGYYQFTLNVKNGWAVLRCNDWDVQTLDSPGPQVTDTRTISWNSAQLPPGGVLNMAYAIGFKGGSFYAGGDLQVNWVKTTTPPPPTLPTVNDSDPLAADFWNSVDSDYTTTQWHQKTWTPQPGTFFRGSQWVAADAASLWRQPDVNKDVGSVMMRRKFVALGYGRYAFTMRIKNGWAVLRSNGLDQIAEPSWGSRPEDIKTDQWTSPILRKNDELNIDFATRFFGGDYNKFWAGGDLAVQ